jgi:hypothetical protein
MTTAEDLNARGQGFLPGLSGVEFLTLEPGRLTSRLHNGRTIQIWDTEVTDVPQGCFAKTSRKTIALFRCTQLILYPRLGRNKA